MKAGGEDGGRVREEAEEVGGGGWPGVGGEVGEVGYEVEEGV